MEINKMRRPSSIQCNTEPVKSPQWYPWIYIYTVYMTCTPFHIARKYEGQTWTAPVPDSDTPRAGTGHHKLWPDWLKEIVELGSMFPNWIWSWHLTMAADIIRRRLKPNRNWSPGRNQWFNSTADQGQEVQPPPCASLLSPGAAGRGFHEGRDWGGTAVGVTRAGGGACVTRAGGQVAGALA